MSSCATWQTIEGEGDADDTVQDVKADLVSAGLVDKTPWDEDWTAFYDHGLRKVFVVFPMTGSENADSSALAIVDNLWKAPQIDGVAINLELTATEPGTGFAFKDADAEKPSLVPGDDSDTVTASSVAIAYDCI